MHIFSTIQPIIGMQTDIFRYLLKFASFKYSFLIFTQPLRRFVSPQLQIRITSLSQNRTRHFRKYIIIGGQLLYETRSNRGLLCYIIQGRDNLDLMDVFSQGIFTVEPIGLLSLLSFDQSSIELVPDLIVGNVLVDRVCVLDLILTQKYRVVFKILKLIFQLVD